MISFLDNTTHIQYELEVNKFTFVCKSKTGRRKLELKHGVNGYVVKLNGKLHANNLTFEKALVYTRTFKERFNLYNECMIQKIKRCTIK